MGSVVHMFFVGPGPFSQKRSVCCGTGHIKDLADRVVFEYPSDCPSWVKGNATARGRVDHIKFNDILIMGERVLNAADMNLLSTARQLRISLWVRLQAGFWSEVH